jgi:hypothetical protein
MNNYEEYIFKLFFATKDKENQPKKNCYKISLSQLFKNSRPCAISLTDFTLTKNVVILYVKISTSIYVYEIYSRITFCALISRLLALAFFSVLLTNFRSCSTASNEDNSLFRTPMRCLIFFHLLIFSLVRCWCWVNRKLPHHFSGGLVISPFTNYFFFA